jgi:hypothetical protein
LGQVFGVSVFVFIHMHIVHTSLLKPYTAVKSAAHLFWMGGLVSIVYLGSPNSSHTILPEQNKPSFRRPFGCLPFLGNREHLDLLSGPFRPLSLRRTPPGGRRSLRDYSPPSILPIPVVMLNTLPRSAGSVHGYKRVLYHSLRSTTSNLNHRLC